MKCDAKMTKIICIAYKPSSDDYCRGCHMASYSSDHIIETFDDVEQVMPWIKDILNKELSINEDGYEITIIVNGMIVVKESHPYSYDDWPNDSPQEFVYHEYYEMVHGKD